MRNARIALTLSWMDQMEHTLVKNYMIIKQKVSDLATFQELFDRLKPKRLEAG
jgi:hypothetical protein